MGLVHQVLVIGVAVDRGHQPLLDGESPVEHIHQWRQAVGGAGGVGNDLLAIIKQAVVNAVNHHGVGIVHRVAHQDAAGASVQVALELCVLLVATTALQHQIHRVLAPGQLIQISGGEAGDPAAINLHGIAVIMHGIGPTAMGGIEGKQVGKHIEIGQVIDGDQFKTLPCRVFTEGPNQAAADAAETIDGNANGGMVVHGASLSADRPGRVLAPCWRPCSCYFECSPAARAGPACSSFSQMNAQAPLFSCNSRGHSPQCALVSRLPCPKRVMVDPSVPPQR